MLDIIQNFQTDMVAGPAWVIWWVRFMGLVLILALPFSLVRVEARWLLLVIIITVPFMLWLYSQFGYQRILGLGHVIPWTPYIIYLWRRRGLWRIGTTLSGKWLALTFLVMSVSLMMDYTDVVRYLLGERI